jgi:glutamine synthetase
MPVPACCETEGKLFSKLGEHGVKYLEVAFQDLEGRIRSRVVKVGAAGHLLNGFRTDGFSIGFLPVESSDLQVVPDLSTLRLYRTRRGVFGFVIADLYYEGKPLPTYPRHLLREVARRAPVEVKVGVELELYLLRGGRPADGHGYWEVGGQGLEVLLDVVEAVDGSVEVHSVHHEVGPGQYELLPAPQDPVSAADTVVFLKRVVRAVAAERGLTATFMPKPFEGLPGSGMHLHFSAERGGEPVFTSDGELTEEGRSFIGGLLAHARELAALTNQSVNSYKRLVPGMEAPVYIAWGPGNRSALVRVPLSGNGVGRTIEYRLPDSCGNTYLAVAAALLAGLRGLQEKADPGPPLRSNAYGLQGLPRVPESLGEAVEELARSRAARDSPLAAVLGKYLELKQREWREYLEVCKSGCPGVTEWEVARYLER